MTGWDLCLLKFAEKIKYYNYQRVYDLVEYADTDECRKKLFDIYDILYHMYQERGYYDPTKAEAMQGLWKRTTDMVKRLLRSMRRKTK